MHAELLTVLYVADTCSYNNSQSIGTDTSISNTNNSPVVKIEPSEDVEYDHGESTEYRECGFDGGNASTTTWIKVQDISLTVKDKWILQHGEKLTDKHINSAQ